MWLVGGQALLLPLCADPQHGQNPAIRVSLAHRAGCGGEGIAHVCTRWIVELSLQTGPNSPFPTAKFILRSFAKGGEKGYGRKNKGTLLRSSKGTAPSPPSVESWRQYRSGIYPWNIRSWLLWRSDSLSSHFPLVNGDKSVQLGELEDRSPCHAGSGRLCLLESACSCRVSAGHGARGHPLAAHPPQVQMEKLQQRGGGRDVLLPGMCFVPIFVSSPSPGQCRGLSSLIAAVMRGKGNVRDKTGTEALCESKRSALP